MDILLLAGCLTVGLGIGGFLLLTRHTGAMVVVHVTGQGEVTFPLNRDTQYLIENDEGGTNLLIIRDGEAWVEEASCPDKLCMAMGHIRQNRQSIVCLPNEVAIAVMDEEQGAQEGPEAGDAAEETGLDAVAGGRQ